MKKLKISLMMGIAFAGLSLELKTAQRSPSRPAQPVVVQELNGYLVPAVGGNVYEVSSGKPASKSGPVYEYDSVTTAVVGHGSVYDAIDDDEIAKQIRKIEEEAAYKISRLKQQKAFDDAIRKSEEEARLRMSKMNLKSGDGSLEDMPGYGVIGAVATRSSETLPANPKKVTAEDWMPPKGTAASRQQSATMKGENHPIHVNTREMNREERVIVGSNGRPMFGSGHVE